MVVRDALRTKRRVNILLASLVGVTATALLSYTAFTLFYPKPATTQQVVSAPPKTPSPKVVPVKQSPFSLPVRLTIPKIGVNANVLHLGVTSEGNMDVPPDLQNVSWYKYGPHPGEAGSAVIAGHLEGVKEPGVFINLGKLVAGDTVSVTDDKTVTTTFTVRETRLYNQDERPAEVFSSSSGAHLNLITCTGTWSNAQQRYSKRLVVFTDKTS